MRCKFAFTAATAALILGIGGVAQAQNAGSGYKSGAPAAQSQRGMGSSGATSGASATEHLNVQTLHELKSDNKAMVPSLSVNADKLADMDIYGTDGKKIGEVNKVLADSSNQVKAVTVDVGGFLGIGAKEVVIPIDKLQKGTKDDQLQTSMTKTEIQDLQNWSDKSNGSNGSSSSGSSGRTTAPSRTSPSR